MATTFKTPLRKPYVTWEHESEPETHTLLFGHDSEDTALYVDDYPYSFQLRTTIRYWIETTKHGDRMVSQTLNPKTDRWNKPKASTYVGLAFLTRNASNGHISRVSCSENDSAEWVGLFRAATEEHMNPLQVRRLLAIIGYTRAMEHVTFSVTDTTAWTPEQRQEGREKDAENNRALNRLIAHETYDATIETVTR